MTNNAKRAAFEKWAYKTYSLERHHALTDQYAAIAVEVAWGAWQARAQASGVPDGWIIERTDSDHIIVRSPFGDGVIISDDHRAIAGTVLYRLAHAMLAAPTPPKSASVPVERLEELRNLCVRKSTAYGSGAFQELADSLAELIAEYKA